MCEKPAHPRNIDPCMKPVIDSINANPRYRTLLSCCGHGVYQKSIVVLDKETQTVFEWFTGKELPRRCGNGRVRKRYYTTDKDGYYFIPGIPASPRGIGHETRPPSP